MQQIKQFYQNLNVSTGSDLVYCTKTE